MDSLQQYKALKEKLAKLDNLAVAFSGGVDSVLLLKAASEALPSSRLLAITARGPIFPGWETAEAIELARGNMDVTHCVLDFNPLTMPDFSSNPPDRCYHCKRALMGDLTALANTRGFHVVADGANLDDVDDFRPGAKASAELGIIHPLKEAGLNKQQIRDISAAMGLPTWNKPAFACLASRFPYGQGITPENLLMVEKAETFLLGLGCREVRVRHHGEVARIEVGTSERSFFFNEKLMDKVNTELKNLGFSFVALDLGGFRSGGFNTAVDEKTIQKYSQ